MIKWLLERKVTTSLLLLFFIGLGTMSLFLTKKQLRPNGFTFPHLYISYSGFMMDPQSVDEQIVVPSLKLFKTLNGLKSIRSSSSDTRASHSIQFDNRRDKNEVYLEVENLIDQSRPLLPSNVKINVFRFNPDSQPIMWIAFTIKEPQALDVKHNERFFEKVVTPTLMRIPGVADVNVYGFRPKNLTVRWRPEVLEKYNLKLADLTGAIQRANDQLTLGQIGEAYFNIKGKTSDVASIENIPITENLLLKQVASVSAVEKPPYRIDRVNGEDSHWINIVKSSDSNVIEISDAVWKSLRKFEDQHPHLEFISIWDQGNATQEALDLISQTAIFGFIITFVIVFLFLRDIRTTIFVSISMPLSIAGITLYLWLTGQSINILSMVAIIVCLGMVIDNAIVVSESIHRRLDQANGKISRAVLMDAIIHGVKSILLPITLGTLTTIAVFLPLIILGKDSEFSFFLIILGVPICIGLLSSLLASVVFLPFLIYHGKQSFGNSAIQSGNNSALTRWLVRLQIKSKRLYRQCLYAFLQRRFWTLVSLVMVCLFTLNQVSQNFRQSRGVENESRVVFNAELDPSLDLNQKEKILKKVEQYFLLHKQEFDYQTIKSDIRRNSSRLRIVLSRSAAPKTKASDLREKVMENMVAIPGLQWNRHEFSQDESDSINSHQLGFFIAGDNAQRIEQLYQKVRTQLLRFPSVEEVHAAKEEDDLREQASLILNFERLYHSMTPASEFIDAIRTNTQSRILVDTDDENPIYGEPVHIPRSQTQIAEIKIKDGISLQSLAEFGTDRPASTTYRKDGLLQKQFQIYFDEKIDKAELPVVMSSVQNYLSSLDLPSGYNINQANFADQDDSNAGFKLALFLSPLLVYALMAALFESFVLPTIVITSIPLAFLGAAWMNTLFAIDFSIMTMLAIIILIGIVVNNGIVLIDLVHKRIRSSFAWQRQRSAYSSKKRRNAIIILACMERTRPVIMTTLTTIASLFPMLLGQTSLLGFSFSPLGYTMVGGMLTSSILTLFVVPVLYSIYHDVSSYFVEHSFGKRMQKPPTKSIKLSSGLSS